MAALKCFSKLNGNHYEISDTDKYFSNPELSEALKEAEEDIAAGRFTELKIPKIYGTVYCKALSIGN